MTDTDRLCRRDGGFTIVELLVVVIIFSFLAIVASTAVSTNVLGASDRPGMTETVSLAARLLEFAGLAVLLFGAGFWYLVELHDAGRLDTFRLGHFLLLALTYSLFFAVFAVLGSNAIEAWLAVAIAACVSYPLLLLHVTTIVNLRFAVTSALPLAMLTTGIVVNGVYGGDLRSYVYLGMVCLVIAHLTLTYPRLARGQEGHRAALELRLTEAVERLAPDAALTRGAVADARAMLALHDPAEHETLRDWVEKRLTSAKATLEGHERMISAHDGMRSASTRTDRRTSRVAGMDLARRLLSRLPQARIALDEATTALTEHRRSRIRIAPDTGDTDHCIACGHVCANDARFCPGCGTPCAATMVCRRCDTVLRLPVHLMTSAAGEERQALHCLGCGERHAG